MLEIACFNNHSACLAEEAGADRIELCADYAVGGTTPRLEDCTLLRNKVQIPIFVMNRPRGGSFVYTEAELTKMRDDISRFKDIADGFVFGVLDESGMVDVAQNTELVTLASPKSCTFHRAFDQIPDKLHALEEVIRCGFQTILTAGGGTSAVAGIETIERLVERSQGRIAIMPGGGIRSSNIADLKSTVGSQWFHSAAITDRDEVADVNEIRELKALS
ncbi:copper homeostasis protein CutC [Viridothelium virens]|uniref:Copper homeostasis protein cutC homolog n=1 Tax=Viridothelium virens TaxID=1048519 RepID=A0A6A6H5V1_VIRVR|nr:copper homeostasis protein CutC [Viridothelium virens]